MPPTDYRASQDASHRPQPIKDVLAELILRRGYAREQSAATYQAAWQSAAGEFFAAHTRCCALKRGGVLEIAVANSLLMQEITFQKVALIAKLAQLLPDAKVRDIKLRVAALS